MLKLLEGVGEINRNSLFTLSNGVTMLMALFSRIKDTGGDIMMSLKRKKRPLDSVEAYACICLMVVCNCNCVCKDEDISAIQDNFQSNIMLNEVSRAEIYQLSS